MPKMRSSSVVHLAAWGCVFALGCATVPAPEPAAAPPQPIAAGESTIEEGLPPVALTTAPVAEPATAVERQSWLLETEPTPSATLRLNGAPAPESISDVFVGCLLELDESLDADLVAVELPIPPPTNLDPSLGDGCTY